MSPDGGPYRPAPLRIRRRWSFMEGRWLWWCYEMVSLGGSTYRYIRPLGRADTAQELWRRL